MHFRECSADPTAPISPPCQERALNNSDYASGSADQALLGPADRMGSGSQFSSSIGWSIESGPPQRVASSGVMKCGPNHRHRSGSEPHEEEKDCADAEGAHIAERFSSRMATAV